MAELSDNRRAQLEALRRSLAHEGGAQHRIAPTEQELRDAVRRAALSRLKGRADGEVGGDAPAYGEAGAPVGEAGAYAGDAGVRAGETSIQAGEEGVRGAEPGVCGAHSVAPALGAHSAAAAAARPAGAMSAASSPATSAPAASAAPAPLSPAAPSAAPAPPFTIPTISARAASAPGAPSAAPRFTRRPAPDFAPEAASAASASAAPTAAPAAAPASTRSMREYVSELLNPKADRGANVLTEPDHEAIAQGKGRHYAKTGGHARAVLAFFLEFLLIFVIALALIFPLRAFVAEYYYIPSGSMEDTLQVDDRILSEKVSYYFDTPKQGQIVTFNGVKEEEGQMLIKRVIAVGGQTVDLRDGAVYVDGEKLDEPYTEGKQSKPLSNSNGITYPYKVPEGEIWVMGDNRTNSLDSRVFGSVPVENVTGHACWRYWPLSSFGALE